MIVLEDMMGTSFTEDDFVVFADGRMSLRIAKVRGIKPVGKGYMVAFDIVEGTGVNRRRYSRRYHRDDFYKVDYVPREDKL